MSITSYKTFAAGEILTAADLNASFAYITTNALAAISPLTGTLDCDGQTVILDADGDSSLRTAIDDVLTLKLQGVDLFVWDGDVALPVNGVTMTATATGVAPIIAATGSDTNIDLQLRGKGTGGIDLGTVSTATTFASTLTHKVGADVASAAALPVNVAGNIFDVTGTTSVTSIAAKGVGTVIILEFDGSLTLTHHATDLVLPGGYNIRTFAGFIATFQEYEPGHWRMISRLQSSSAGCQVIAYLTSDQNTATAIGAGNEIGSGAATYTEVLDRGGDFDATTGRFTAPVTGVYEIDFIGSLQSLSANATETFYMIISDDTLSAYFMVGNTASGALAATNPVLQSNGSYKELLTAGAIRSMWAYHDSDGTRAVSGGGMAATSISITLVS